VTGPGHDWRAAVLAREAGRLAGNRLWRLETPGGPVLQKYYCQKAGPLRTAWRAAWTRWIRGATSPRAVERWRTEREMLALWGAAGIAVPRDRTAEFPHLAGERVAILEWIEGRDLARLLAAGGLPRPERDAVLCRFGAAWGGRQRLAMERGDPRFAQVHGSLVHYLVSGERMVCIDHEQAYFPGRPVLPALAREAASCLRSLAKCGDPETFRRDLAAVAAGHPDRALLRSLAEAVSRLPFAGRGKRALGAALAEAAGSPS